MIEGLGEYHRRTGRTDVAEVIVGGRCATCSPTPCAQRPDGGFDFMYCYEKHGRLPAVDRRDNYAVPVALARSRAPTSCRTTRSSRSGPTSSSRYGEAKMREHRDIRSWTSALGFPFWFVDLAAHK